MRDFEKWVTATAAKIDVVIDGRIGRLKEQGERREEKRRVL